MSSLSISVENVSKVYRLGEINRGQFFGDVRRWVKGRFNPDHTFGDPETEAEQEPKAADLFYALKNVSFDIKQGETVGIIGANGAGKSTLLKLISRITAPSTGKIKINGRIGSLLEVGTGFHPDLTGRDNVFMNGAILGMNRSEVSAKFDDIVSFSGVEKFIDTPVKRYSSGMFVRLAFSVAAFLEPEILIVDEVLSVGDQQFQNRCMQRLQEIIKDGRTVLFVSHAGAQIRKLCTRAICLKQGEVICDEDPYKALEYYQGAVRESGPVLNQQEENNHNSSEIIFKLEERPGNNIVKINWGRLIGKNGEIATRVLTSEEFFLEFQFEVLQEGVYLRPACIIHDELGNILFWTGDTEKEKKEPIKEGNYITRLAVPKHLLAPGIAVINFDVGEDSSTGESHAQVSDALRIQVEDDLSDQVLRGAYRGFLPGFIRPKLEWKTARSVN